MTSDRNIAFNSLSPGKYTLELFSERNPAFVTTLTIEVIPAWWQTKTFYLLLLLLAVALVYMIAQRIFQYQQKIEQEKQHIQNKIRELEISALRSQMNPHFIFNTLTSLQYYMNMGEVESANVVITKFARLIRKTLDISQTAEITIAEEMEYLNNYLYLEKIRFKDKFTYEVMCDASVTADKQKIPSLVLQPFVENAIRHGIKHKVTYDGWVKVRFYMQDALTFVCEIEDNGVGRAAAKAFKEKQTIQTYDSKGMMLSMSRIELLKSLKQQEASIQIVDKQDEAGNATGTLIRIIFIENSNLDQ